MAYEIGYRRPPPSGQFKKGASGNPKGRPRGSKNFFTLLDQELAQPIVVNVNGRRKTVSRLQAMVKQMVADALQGDQKARLTLVEILRRTDGMQAPDVDALLPENYESILNAYVETRQKAAANKSTLPLRKGGEA